MALVRALLLLPLLKVACAAPPRWNELTAEYSYEQYIKDFRKESGGVEGQQRFERNLAGILAHNSKAGVSFRRGVNQWTDTAPALGRKVPGDASSHKLTAPQHVPADILSLALEDLPAQVDWRDQGVVSPVKNQGHCGSCWAFATTATVESHIALSTGLLFSLSPEQLVACAPNDDHCGGTGGCQGSIPELAYDYLIQEGGFAEEWSYPYQSYGGRTTICKNVTTTVAGISGYVKLPENNASAVMAALATVGPLAINVDASNWHDYESGVYDGCSYDEMEIDHVVVLVGYGTDEETGEDYWLVRNSWSPTWGESGYIRLKRDPVNSTPCGVDNNPQDGTGCDNATVQYPCGMCGTIFDVSYPTGAFV
eukprot:CAMPEP_0118962106 /NCGR_PEP_ID=MMETSP1173-20130426/556_1 /TAXON_ID=1034831 /ORGANISM="Rhizochromulina marina cf, Strain CCMP1243" /LENGTH=366 /DNA_ID=CAMNT_0006910325 /DNA_START=22 /DNA_END=1122 /DNA_ORIENTATION=-